MIVKTNHFYYMKWATCSILCIVYVSLFFHSTLFIFRSARSVALSHFEWGLNIWNAILVQFFESELTVQFVYGVQTRALWGVVVVLLSPRALIPSTDKQPAFSTHALPYYSIHKASNVNEIENYLSCNTNTNDIMQLFSYSLITRVEIEWFE